ncbi:MAG: hypothetical protein VX642_09680 [Bdellovibrionota bacterium]|nr:hypothetical protein [Bdellovibrionota bacterium]
MTIFNLIIVFLGLSTFSGALMADDIYNGKSEPKESFFIAPDQFQLKPEPIEGKTNAQGKRLFKPTINKDVDYGFDKVLLVTNYESEHTLDSMHYGFNNTYVIAQKGDRTYFYRPGDLRSMGYISGLSEFDLNKTGELAFNSYWLSQEVYSRMLLLPFAGILVFNFNAMLSPFYLNFNESYGSVTSMMIAPMLVGVVIAEFLFYKFRNVRKKNYAEKKRVFSDIKSNIEFMNRKSGEKTYLEFQEGYNMSRALKEFLTYARKHPQSCKLSPL